MPWWPFEKTAEMLPRLLTPNSFPTARWLARPDQRGWRGLRAYVARFDGTPFEALRPALAYGCVAAWIVVLGAGLAGIVLAWDRPLAKLFLLYSVLHIVPVLVTFGVSRFRLPLVPVLLITSAWLVVNRREAWAAAGHTRRAAVAVTVAVAFGTAATEWATILVPWWG